MSNSNSQVSTIGNKGANANSNAKVEKDVAPANTKAKFGPEFSGDRAVVTISASKEDGGNEAVFVSVHGVAFQIPRSKPYVVPVEVVNVLKDAVETTYSREMVNGKEEVVRRDSQRYTFAALPYTEGAPVATA